MAETSAQGLQELRGYSLPAFLLPHLQEAGVRDDRNIDDRADEAYDRCVQKEMDSLFDQADEMDLARWHQADLEAERLEILEQALDECAARGVSRENLKTLARETGATDWALKQSLKGNGDASHG